MYSDQRGECTLLAQKGGNVNRQTPHTHTRGHETGTATAGETPPRRRIRKPAFCFHSTGEEMKSRLQIQPKTKMAVKYGRHNKQSQRDVELYLRVENNLIVF